ncbi:hypothetical protein TNCV_658021 [Trichonephila clavipes]|uniref:Uncharacterized protein n=1 Tax=Trichonephila clavipes TaxID=2585209 RepID=A0A8X6VLD3_TRICX|nr:hypothetical protein TNCV_658021 [Trichonephila clavipes]
MIPAPGECTRSTKVETPIRNPITEKNPIFYTAVWWRGWFVAGLLHLRLRVQPRPKSEDFHDAENQQRPCRMIIQALKNS